MKYMLYNNIIVLLIFEALIIWGPKARASMAFPRVALDFLDDIFTIT